jgi:acylpyruvate hydrolase
MSKIICLGKNYAEHAKELGDEVPQKPVIFLKPLDCLVQLGKTSGAVMGEPFQGFERHYECEIVLEVQKTTNSKLKLERVGLGLDMTLRSLQAQLKKQGHPWTTAKVFPNSAVLGPMHAVAEHPNWECEPFSFFLNGEKKQSAKATDMIMNVETSLEYINSWIPVQTGDLIFTGTPAGVGAVKKGDIGCLEWLKTKTEILFF